MLIILVDFLKIILLTGLVFAIWNLSMTRLLMPKIFWLIALFVQLAFLLMLHGVEFIAFVILLLYVGAISVLFLFVVMILNPDAKRELTNPNTTALQPSWTTAYFTLTPILVTLLLSLLAAEAYSLEFYAYLQGFWVELWPFLIKYNLLSTNTVTLDTSAGWGSVSVAGLAPHSDLWFIAESFYTQDFVLFWLVGFILLVSMVGAILLTLQKSRGLKRQKGTNQSKRYHAFNR